MSQSVNPKLLAAIRQFINTPVGPQAANGGYGGLPDYSKYINGGLAKQEITSDQFREKYGVDWNDLSPEIQAKMNSLYTINASMGEEHHSAINSLLHGAGSALNRVGDVLMRPEYAFANALKSEFDSVVEGDNPLEMIGGMAKAGWRGLAGYDKTVPSEVIQHGADVYKGAQEGLTPEAAITDAEAHPGKFHLPAGVRWGVGLPADILIDPLNAVGVGAVTKVIRGPQYIKDIEKLNNLAKTGGQLGATAKLEEALKAIPKAEQESIRAEIKAEMEAQGKHFEIGHGDTPGPGGLVTKLMKSGKYKTGAHAKTAALAIVEKNTLELDSKVEARMRELARDRAFTDATPQELELQLQAALGTLNDLGHGWQMNSRVAKSGLRAKDRASQLNDAIEAIRNVQAVKLKKAVEDIPTTGIKPVLSDADIEAQVAKYADEYATSPKTQVVVHAAPEVSVKDPQLLDAIYKELDRNPGLNGHIKQIIAVDNIPDMAKGTAGASRHKNYGNFIRLNKSELDNAAQLAKEDRAFFKEHGYKKHSVVTTMGEQYRKAVVYHELGHQLLHFSGVTEKELSAHMTELFGKEWTQKNVAHKISATATENMRELVAESLAAERLMQGNEWTKAIVDFVEKRANEKFAAKADPALKDVPKLTPEAYKEQLLQQRADTLAHNVKHGKKNPAQVAKLQKRNEEETIRLMAAAKRVIDPALGRRVAIKLTGTDHFITIPGSGRILRTAKGFNESENFFNNALRASAGVPPEVTAEARKYASQAQVRIEKQIDLLREVWGPVNHSTRARVIQNWIKGGGKVTGAQGEDLVKNFQASLREIQKDLEEWLDPRILVKELDHQLPEQLKFRNNKLANAVWKDSTKTELKDDWLERGLKEIVKGSRLTPAERGHVKNFMKDPAAIVASVRGAAEKAKNLRVMRNDLAETLGHRAFISMEGNKTVLDPATRTLVDKFGYKQLRIQLYRGGKEITPVDLKHVYFPPEVADGITKVYRVLNNSTHINDFVHTYDQALRIWKTLITRFNPGYHERNLMGEVTTSWFGGVWHPKWYKKASAVVWKHDSRFLDPNRVEKAKRRTIRAQNALMSNPAEAARLMAEKGDVPLGKPVIHFHGRPMYHDEIWHLFTQEAGLHTGFISSDFANPLGSGRFGAVGAAAGKAGEGAQFVTEQVEDFARMAHFIHALSRSGHRDLGKAVEEAAAEVRKFHHDFADFTHFETTILSRLVPFYKWTRKNLPLMAEVLITQPGKADKFFTIPEGISRAAGFQAPDGTHVPFGDPLVPEWLQDNGAVPIGHLGGDTQYLDLPLPFLDALKMVSDPVGSTGFMVTPALKVLLEEATKHQIGGAPITSQAKYLAQQTPYSNIGYKQTQPEGKLSAALQFLLGIGLQPNTDRRMLSEAIRQVNEASERRKEQTK